MIEIITQRSPEEQYQSQILDEFVATLNPVKLYNSSDLYEAARTFTVMPEVSSATNITIYDNDVAEDVVPIPELLFTPQAAPVVEQDDAPIPAEVVWMDDAKKHRSLKDRYINLPDSAKRMGRFAAALVVIAVGVRFLEPKLDLNSTKDAAAASVPNSDPSPTTTTATAITIQQTPALVEVQGVGISTDSDETTTTTNTAVSNSIVSIEVASTSPDTSVAAEEITTTSTMPAVVETVPEPVTLTEQVLNGEKSLADFRGLIIGTLELDKYCDTVEVYVNNGINYKDPEIVKLLSLEAQAKVQELNSGNLTRERKRQLIAEIQQYGLVDAAGNRFGDPLYALYPDRTPKDPTCVQEAPNPRANQPSYGSTEADQLNDEADYWQPVAVMSEFGNIPITNGTTYISGHRSEHSAPFNGLVNYETGDTVTYTGDDGQTLRYTLVEKVNVDSSIPLPELIKFLSQEGKGRLILQVCIDGDPDNRALLIFDAIEA